MASSMPMASWLNFDQRRIASHRLLARSPALASVDGSQSMTALIGRSQMACHMSTPAGTSTITGNACKTQRDRTKTLNNSQRLAFMWVPNPAELSTPCQPSDAADSTSLPNKHAAVTAGASTSEDPWDDPPVPPVNRPPAPHPPQPTGIQSSAHTGAAADACVDQSPGPSGGYVFLAQENFVDKIAEHGIAENHARKDFAVYLSLVEMRDPRRLGAQQGTGQQTIRFW